MITVIVIQRANIKMMMTRVATCSMKIILESAQIVLHLNNVNSSWHSQIRQLILKDSIQ